MQNACKENVYFLIKKYFLLHKSQIPIFTECFSDKIDIILDQ